MLATLNPYLMWGLQYCFRVFLGRDHFSSPLPLLVFLKNIILLKLSVLGGG